MKYVWVEKGESCELHPMSDSSAGRFARSLASDERVTFVAIISVFVDGDCESLRQDVVKGHRDGSRKAISYAQENLF